MRPTALAHLFMRVAIRRQHLRLAAVVTLKPPLVLRTNATIVVLHDENSFRRAGASTLIHVLLTRGLLTAQETMDTAFASTRLERHPGTAFTAIPTEVGNIRCTCVEPNDLKIHSSDVVMPVVIWYPKLLCAGGSVWPIELLATPAAGTRGI